MVVDEAVAEIIGTVLQEEYTLLDTGVGVFRYCKALYDVKFRQIEGNGQKFSPIKLSNSVVR